MSIADLWAPILVASVAIFLVSSVLHVVVPWHKGDASKLPDEERVIEAMRVVDLQPGHYFFPGADSMKDLSDPAFIEKSRRGPVGSMIVKQPGPPDMNKALVFWFLQTIVVGTLVAYLASMVLVPGAGYAQVFRVTATAAMLSYAFSTVHESIWKGGRWSVTGKFFLDGVLYALVTGGAFAGFWPEA